ncbi:MAG: IS1 family transposase [Terriglobia bacterium]
MKRLTREKQTQIISALIEGCSIRSTSRMFGVSKDTVLKLQVEAGYLAADYQDRVFRGLGCRRVQCDEVWAFCWCKDKNIPAKMQGKTGIGSVWTWTAIDADTKLIPSFTVGNRDAAGARILIDDLASRLARRIQLTTDGLRVYVEAIEGAFGADIDYAMLVKVYAASQEETRYSPAECVGCERKKIMGNPDPADISTSYVERANLSIRMGIRRFTRLTNAFSKKIENHAAAVGLYLMHYNFCRVHQTLRVTPAMQSGLTGHIWSIIEMLKAIGLPCGSYENSN